VNPRRISYEIVPGSIFPTPPGLRRASYGVRARAQERAERLFEKELLERLGLEGQLRGAAVARGGWEGNVSPSTQLLFDPATRRDLLGAYAAALGLIWRQDAVAVSFLHPDGACLVVRISRVDGKPLTGAQMQRFYELLYEHDTAKRATIGFTE
jgi:hypothetical protein